ncbi:hypothetical protein GCK72_025896 [Caenorhabditis remanei]|uniref:Uncharacterized protein n=1 Tax=Caenorhabditis remanei TaxID=31234 RepID=A0A6A5G365_CAERE|nr:hypothetical protein GCK72_025896 [Caenorhabditis remanei]KAF1749428.1 hypothetical protein GCK72_025896 [Caenorhabditis remanei]
MNETTCSTIYLHDRHNENRTVLCPRYLSPCHSNLLVKPHGDERWHDDVQRFFRSLSNIPPASLGLFLVTGGRDVDTVIDSKLSMSISRSSGSDVLAESLLDFSSLFGDDSTFPVDAESDEDDGSANAPRSLDRRMIIARRRLAREGQTEQPNVMDSYLSGEELSVSTAPFDPKQHDSSDKK